MIFSKIVILFSLVLIGFQLLPAQSKQRRFADLPSFERAMVHIRYFEGMHGKKNYPYVGYGHQLLPGEHFMAAVMERQTDSLLRADLWEYFEHFGGYGRDALLLTLLTCNVGVGRLLDYGGHPESRLVRRMESGDRNYYREFVSFYRYKGKVLRELVRRRKVEFALFYIPWLSDTPLATFLCSVRGVFLLFFFLLHNENQNDCNRWKDTAANTERRGIV